MSQQSTRVKSLLKTVTLLQRPQLCFDVLLMCSRVSRNADGDAEHSQECVKSPFDWSRSKPRLKKAGKMK